MNVPKSPITVTQFIKALGRKLVELKKHEIARNIQRKQYTALREGGSKCDMMIERGFTSDENKSKLEYPLA